jgi:hypothetical protein
MAFSGSKYWGLTQQKGPWHSTPQDVRNAKESLYSSGVSDDVSFVRPYSVISKHAVPKPSPYADLKTRAGKMKGVVGGIRPTALPVAARTLPFYTGVEAGAISGVPGAYTLPHNEQVQEDVEMVTSEMSTLVPETFALTEHRMEEVKQEEPLVRQEREAPLPRTPVGVIRKPRHKIKTTPYEKGFDKTKKADTVREDPMNILQLRFPVKEEVVTTYQPPSYDQVTEVKKGSKEAMKSIRKSDKPMNFEPWEEKKRGEEFLGKRKLPHTRVGKRKAESETSTGRKVQKTKGADLVLPRGEKRKAESEKSTGRKVQKTKGADLVLPRGEKRKATTFREGGEKKLKAKGKPVLNKLKMDQLPPPSQRRSEMGGFGRAENKSAPSKFGLPDVRPKRKQ